MKRAKDRRGRQDKDDWLETGRECTVWDRGMNVFERTYVEICHSLARSFINLLARSLARGKVATFEPVDESGTRPSRWV